MEKVKFENWLDRRFAHQQRRHCRAGDRIHIDYQPVYDAKGIWHLEESGKTNTYLEIQSHAGSCDINIIMARYRNGETDVLSQIQGMYGDVTSVPTNYAEIQSHADSCDINIIMARYRNGETDVLSQIQGMYGDVTSVPTNYAEIMNAQLRAKELFLSLAPEVREKYGNSVEQFMSSFSSREGWEAIGFKFDEPVSAQPAPADQKEGAE